MPSELAPPSILLTLAVPTYNRADRLRILLEILLAQLKDHPEVELLVSDNGSKDATAAVVASARECFLAAGVAFRDQRHPENLGPDGNFLSCFRAARGHFFWICGDDDVLLPGALDKVLALLWTPDGEPAAIDLLHLTSFGFREDYVAERRSDPLGRSVHHFHNAHRFAVVVNMMFTFVSGMVVNKARLATIAAPPPEEFVGTNLVQLAFCLPLLREFRRGAVIWERLIGSRLGHANSYSLGRVFGENLVRTTERLLPGRPELSGPILGFALRRWFPAILVNLRQDKNDALELEKASGMLRRTFRRDPRFWVFTYPALTWPLTAARLYTRLTAALGKLVFLCQVPGFWRKQV